MLLSLPIVVEIFFFRVKTNIRFHVGDVEVAAVPCGFGRAIGNKVGQYCLLCCFALHISFDLVSCVSIYDSITIFSNKGCIKIWQLVMIMDLVIVSFGFVEQSNMDI